MKKVLLIFLHVMVFSVAPLSSQAETFYEVSSGLTKMSFDINNRGIGSKFVDESEAVNFSVGAYRHSSDNTAWGVVIEVTSPVSRDDDLPGSGRILGFRPINFLWHAENNLSVELFAGAAQYEWRKRANGIYLGAGMRYEWTSNWSMAVEARYYQDLAFDASGDSDIVDGFNTAIKLFYRFK